MITIDQKLAEMLQNWVVDGWPVGNLVLCTIAIVLSILLCGAIGYERQRRGRAAGLRTHLLVGVGSCIVMIISIYGFPETAGSRDVARLAAQVITGVGFLGAGAIIYRNSGTKGLTTAATIWIAMAIGLACGSMNFILATGGTIAILLCLTLFLHFEIRISSKTPMFHVRAKPETALVSFLTKAAKQFDATIRDLEIKAPDEAGHLDITFFAVCNKRAPFPIQEFLVQLEAIEGIELAEVVNDHRY